MHHENYFNPYFQYHIFIEVSSQNSSVQNNLYMQLDGIFLNYVGYTICISALDYVPANC